MKQSELHRDIFEPGWREKEQAHYAKLIDAVPTIKQSLQVQTMTTQTAYQDYAPEAQYWLAANMRNGVTAGEYASAMRKVIDAALASQAAEVERLREWQQLAFAAHPNIDLDIDAARVALETGK